MAEAAVVLVVAAVRVVWGGEVAKCGLAREGKVSLDGSSQLWVEMRNVIS